MVAMLLCVCKKCWWRKGCYARVREVLEGSSFHAAPSTYPQMCWSISRSKGGLPGFLLCATEGTPIQHRYSCNYPVKYRSVISAASVTLLSLHHYRRARASFARLRGQKPLARLRHRHRSPHRRAQLSALRPLPTPHASLAPTRPRQHQTLRHHITALCLHSHSLLPPFT